MKYMLIMFDREDDPEAFSDEEFQKWFEVTEEMEKAGIMVGGEALKPSNTATTVRGKKSEGFSTIDGPFAETKEQIGGFYIIEAKDLDEAVHWASRMPHVSRGGSVEIRPIMIME